MGHHEAWLDNDRCGVVRATDIVGERWKVLVLREAFYGTRRFEDFQRNLGIARNILSDRLKNLVAHGVLERRRYQERPARDEYRLTDKGRDLYPILVSFLRWSERHDPLPEGPPVILEHRTCGNECRPVLVCDQCGDALTARDVRATAGPGATVA